MIFKKKRNELDSEGNVTYRKTKTGDEKYTYNTKNEAIFVTDKENNQIYCKDSKNNEIYPSKGYPFAMNKFQEFYYAKNRFSDKYYPTRKGVSLMIHTNGDVIIARYKSQRQRYPIDRKENNYFPVDRNGKPFYLLDENGREYYPKTRRNNLMSLEKNFGDLTTLYDCKYNYLKNVYYTNERNGWMKCCGETVFCCSTVVIWAN